MKKSYFPALIFTCRLLTCCCSAVSLAAMRLLRKVNPSREVAAKRKDTERERLG